MSVKLNERAFDHAKKLIENGDYVLDDRDAWSEHRPTAQQENEYIEKHGFGEYARWYLGIDDEFPPDKKGRYKFPYGDFEKVHRCGLLAAESRAGQRKYTDIELAVAHLHGMLEALD
jgi:O-glycosyl hydrolase